MIFQLLYHSKGEKERYEGPCCCMADQAMQSVRVHSVTWQTRPGRALGCRKLASTPLRGGPDRSRWHSLLFESTHLAQAFTKSTRIIPSWRAVQSGGNRKRKQDRRLEQPDQRATDLLLQAMCDMHSWASASRKLTPASAFQLNNYSPVPDPKNADCLGLVQYRTCPGIVSFFYSGTGQSSIPAFIHTNMNTNTNTHSHTHTHL